MRECRNTSTTSTPVEEMVEVCQDPDQETNITDADDGACTLRWQNATGYAEMTEVYKLKANLKEWF